MPHRVHLSDMRAQMVGLGVLQVDEDVQPCAAVSCLAQMAQTCLASCVDCCLPQSVT